MAQPRNTAELDKMHQHLMKLKTHLEEKLPELMKGKDLITDIVDLSDTEIKITFVSTEAKNIYLKKVKGL